MEYVYAVGSDEEKFVVDRIYSVLDDAIKYCNSRDNEKIRWLVMQAPLGESWICWKTVYNPMISKR